MELRWEGVAGDILKSQSKVIKEFMHKYPGAAVFFLVYDVPAGIALVQVRPFSSGIFRAQSFNPFQLLQDIFGDAYNPLTAGRGTRGLFVLSSQHIDQCGDLVKR
jgi:hypothetical protein